MDEEQVVYELKLIYREIKLKMNPKIPMKDFLVFHFKNIRFMNDGYFVMKDAKTYIDQLKAQFNV